MWLWLACHLLKWECRMKIQSRLSFESLTDGGGGSSSFLFLEMSSWQPLGESSKTIDASFLSRCMFSCGGALAYASGHVDGSRGESGSIFSLTLSHSISKRWLEWYLLSVVRIRDWAISVVFPLVA